MITAADLMTKNVISITPDQPVAEVAALFLKSRVSALPVVDDNNYLLGIVSEGDLIRSAETNHQPHRSRWLVLLTGSQPDTDGLFGKLACTVGDVMTKDILMASEHEPLTRLIELLAKSRIKRLPIVRQKKLVGIVSRVDILQYLASTFSRTGRLVA